MTTTPASTFAPAERAVDPRPSRDEDAVMRRLTFFQELGCELASPVQELVEEVRARDTRDEIREPADHVVVLPVEEAGVTLP